MISRQLGNLGYDCGYTGKWHLDGHNDMSFVPRERRGRFDTWVGYENNNAQYDCWVHGHDTQGRDDTKALAEKLDGYETDVLTEHFLNFLEKPRTQPFFGILSVQPPHDPHNAPEAFLKNYDPATLELRPNVPPVSSVEERAREDLAGYYAQIENLDENVGRILNFLDTCGLSENTWVFFFSDHGDMHGSHGYWRKSSPWEESVRIPFIVKAPKHITHAPASTPSPLNHVDIAPTALGLCGLDVPDTMMGTDWSHIFDTQKQPTSKPPRSAYLQQVFRKRFDCLNRTWRGVRTDDGWKYVCLEGQPLGMFNLNEDPYELNNLAFKDPFNDKREELQAELAKWIEQTGDSFTPPEL